VIVDPRAPNGSRKPTNSGALPKKNPGGGYLRHVRRIVFQTRKRRLIALAPQPVASKRDK
jgi:hypothetical protein